MGIQNRYFKQLRECVFDANFQLILSLIAIFAVGLVLRLLSLRSPIKLDEAISYYRFIKPDLAQSLLDYSDPNNHFLNTILAKFSLENINYSDLGLRLPAVLFGFMAFVIIVKFLLAHFGNTIAVIVALYISLSTPYAVFSSTARGYVFGVFFFYAALLSAHSIIYSNHKGYKAWLILVFATALACYSVLTMLYAVGIPFIWIVAVAIFEKNKKLLRKAIAFAFLAAVITSSALYPAFKAIYEETVSVPLNIINGKEADFYNFIFFGLSELVIDLPEYSVIVALIGIAVYALFGYKKNSRLYFLFLSVLVSISAVLALTAIPYARALLFILPLFAAYACLGLSVFFKKISGEVRLLVVCAVCGYIFFNQFSYSYYMLKTNAFENGINMRKISQAIASHLGQDQKIILQKNFEYGLRFYSDTAEERYWHMPDSPSMVGQGFNVYQNSAVATESDLLKFDVLYILSRVKNAIPPVVAQFIEKANSQSINIEALADVSDSATAPLYLTKISVMPKQKN